MADQNNESSDESVFASNSDTEKPQFPDLIIKPSASNPSSTGKRPPDSKRAAAVVAVAALDADTYEEKKQLFQMPWSDNNEIVLIQGMINYVNQKGKDPLADVTDFHELFQKLWSEDNEIDVLKEHGEVVLNAIAKSSGK